MPRKIPTAKRNVRASNARPRAGQRFDDIDSIIEAARVCFARFGVARTRLEDVAAEAGISRPLLYQFFAHRQALMDAVINREIELHLAAQAKQMPVGASFADTVIEASIIAIELARRDSILVDLIEHSSVRHLPELLLNSDQPVHRTVLGLWQPIFEAARQRGEMRADLDDHDVMEWLLSVNYMLGLRDDITPARQRELLTLFVAPALAPGGLLNTKQTAKPVARKAATHATARKKGNRSSTAAP